MKLYAYENYDGDKGVIVADTYDKAKEIYMREYPFRKIVDTSEIYEDNEAYLFEVNDVGNNKLFCTFPI